MKILSVDDSATIQSEAVDFVITDWSMPVMTGLEMVHALRSNPATKSLPVLMVTAVGEKEEIVQAVSAGVSGQEVPDDFEEATAARVGGLPAAGAPA